MTFYEIQKELETIVKAETPDSLAMAYAKLWGMAVAHLTEEQMSTLLRHRKETKWVIFGKLEKRVSATDLVF